MNYRYWLHRGIGVKRWILLASGGAVLAAVGLLALVGRDLVALIYGLLPTSALSYAIAGLLLLAGGGAVLYDATRAVRSIAGGLKATPGTSAGKLLYERRQLSRGPRVVAIGGGTGLSTLLRGLKHYTANITAIVTVMDDGGSSGRLRRELNMLPPGDIRNCLVALAEDESRVARLFSHRFANGNADLSGHSLGNLALAGLQEITGGFDRAVEELSAILNVRGRVLPATLENVDLVAQMDDGKTVRGEHAIAEDSRGIAQIMLSKPHVAAYPKAIEAVREADLIVLGPGSLYTSILPNLLVEGLAAEIERSPVPTIYVANVMTQPGETDGYSVRDHVDVIAEYLDPNAIDAVLVNSAPIPDSFLTSYRAEGAEPVHDDMGGRHDGPRVIRAPVVDVAEMDGKQTIKHAPAKLATAIVTEAMSRREWPSLAANPSKTESRS